MQEQNEDLHAQLLSSQVQEGQNLLERSGVSLAEEIESLPRDEVKGVVVVVVVVAGAVAAA